MIMLLLFLKRDIDKYHETASSLDDDACLEDEIQESLTSNIIFWYYFYFSFFKNLIQLFSYLYRIEICWFVKFGSNNSVT